MEQNGLKNLRNGLREVAATLATAQYWTERREACEQLFNAARQIVYQLRVAAGDKDPDIQHWGRNSCDQLKRDLATDPASLKPLISNFLATPPDQEEVAGKMPDQAARKPQPPTTDDLLQWLRDFARQMHGTFQERPKGASVTLPVNGDRKQTVLIDLSHHDSSGNTMALFYSICGEARPETWRWALESNCGMNRGAFGVIKNQDKDVLILLLRRPLDELVMDRLGSKLRFIASKADEAEARLKTQDMF